MKLIAHGIVAAILVAAAPPPAGAQTTWYVDDDAPNDPGPGDPTLSDLLEDGSAEHPFDAIQEAVDAASDDDDVIVEDGTYWGSGNKNLDFGGKLIRVQSRNGRDRCVIDCQHNGRAFLFHNGETATAAVRGFTIQHGLDEDGGAIRCYRSSPTIADCAIVHNRGSGIYCTESSSPLITGCIIRNNVACTGAGVYCKYSCMPVIVNSVIANNAAVTCSGRGGGLRLDYWSHATVTNCTIVGNTAVYDGGGVHCSHRSDPELTNCILWNNTPEEVGTNVNDLPLITYSNVRGGYDGMGNIAADPGLAFADDYHLVRTSPCIDAGFNAPPGGLTPHDIESTQRPLDGDQDGAAVADMGAYEFDPAGPSVAVSPSVTEYFLPNGSAFPSRPLLIRNAGGGTLRWEVDALCPWLDAAPPVGESAGEVDEILLTLQPVTLPHGTHRCVVQARDPGASNSPRQALTLLHVNSTLRVPSPAYPTIQAAIDAAVPGDVVLLSDGVYVGPGNIDIEFRGKDITVRSKNGPADCVIDCRGQGRAFNLIYGETSAAVIEGLTIVNGAGLIGGAIHCSASSLTVRNCRFADNRARSLTTGRGGAILSTSGTLSITDSVFSQNRARSGGAVCCVRGSLVLAGCTFVGNEAVGEFHVPFADLRGGAVRAGWSTVTMSNCRFEKNSASRGGGGVLAGGGSVEITDSSFSANNGDAVQFDLHLQRVAIQRCIMENNAGSGIWARDVEDLDVAHCILRGNYSDEGAGIYVRNCEGSIRNTAIVGNRGHYGYAQGAAVYCLNSQAILTFNNCLIMNNRAAPQGAGLMYFYFPAGMETLITNSIIWDNIPNHINGQQPTITFSNVQGGAIGEGNINADPLVVRPGLHLRADSPCIDSGDVAAAGALDEDIDGEPRVVGAAVDMGVDEFSDTDGDSLPDWWEAVHFGAAPGGRPDGDEDGDGLANRVEYALGRDPWQGPRSYFVDAAGDDAWDGLAAVWDGNHGPKGTIAAAMDAAHAYEGDVITLAPGVYEGEGNRDLDSAGKAITVKSENPLDPGVVGATIIDCRGENSERHDGFLFASSEGSDSILSGITIREGSRAVRCYGSGPTIAHCVFEGNTAPFDIGSAIQNRVSNPIVRDCIFRENHNSAIYNVSSWPIFDGCVFVDNWAWEDGAAIYNDGYGPVEIRRCTFENNRADRMGGAVYTRTYSPLVLTDCTFNGNSSGTSGGAIGGRMSTGKLMNCAFFENSAGHQGGSIKSANSDPLIMANCLFSGNAAAAEGGAIYVFGGALATLSNCTFAGNEASSGRAIACSRFDQHRMEVANSILWNGGNEIWTRDDPVVLIRHSNVQGGWPGEGNLDVDPLFADADGPDDVPGTPDDDLRPGIGSPCIDAGDNTAVPEDGGDLDGDGDTLERVPLDLNGAPRFVDSPYAQDRGRADRPDYPVIVDMGAYEYQPGGLRELEEAVIALELAHGIERSLLAKLGAAARVLQDANARNDVAACNAIRAFIHALEALSGRHVAEADAQALVEAAKQTLELLGCFGKHRDQSGTRLIRRERSAPDTQQSTLR